MTDLTIPYHDARRAEHLRPHWFGKGQSGNPAGRPEGARSKLSHACIAALNKDFAEFGEKVIRQVRETNPTAYLSAVVALIPKQKQELPSAFADLTDDELEQLEKFLKATRAKSAPPLIDAEPSS